MKTEGSSLSEKSSSLWLPEKPRIAALRFSPYAWAKFKYLRDKGSTEVAAFGIGLHDDPLAIIDIVAVEQQATAVTAEFDDIAVSNFFEDQVGLGRKPHQFARIWLHTHPGNCATPSGVDEATFTRVFGACDWAVMAVLACGGDLSARLRYNTGIRAEFQIKIEIDYSLEFEASNHEAWDLEYEKNVHREVFVSSFGRSGAQFPSNGAFHGHMPGRTMWDDNQDWKQLYEHDDSYTQITSPRSRGIGAARMAEDDESNYDWDEQTAPNSDDSPDTWWTLEEELDDKTPEERKAFLEGLDIDPVDVQDYICYYENGVLTCELNSEAARQEEEEEIITYQQWNQEQLSGAVESENGFTDSAGELPQ